MLATSWLDIHYKACPSQVQHLKPPTFCFFNNLSSVLILTWQSLLCHDHPSDDLVNKHVLKFAYLEVKPTIYKLYLMPLNMTWSIFDTTNHWKTISHNCSMDSKLNSMKQLEAHLKLSDDLILQLDHNHIGNVNHFNHIHIKWQRWNPKPSLLLVKSLLLDDRSPMTYEPCHV